jgi:GxxExxY protein
MVKETDTKLLYRELTEIIIGTAMEIHRSLGPGFIESIYENAMAVELQNRNVFIEKQKAIPIKFKGVLVGEHILDCLVEQKVVVEYKAVSELAKVHEAQVISYLKATSCKIGLLFNFSKESLEFKRIKLKDMY